MGKPGTRVRARRGVVVAWLKLQRVMAGMHLPAPKESKFDESAVPLGATAAGDG